jgi:hypothetical protein
LRIGNESLHQGSNDIGVRIVNFATSKNLVVRSTMFQHRNIHKYTWTCPDGKTHGQIDHILTDGRWHSSIFDVHSFRGVDYGTDHCLVVAKARKDLRTISKRAAHMFDMERFNLGKLSELDIRKEYQIEISNRITALENLSNSEDIHK